MNSKLFLIIILSFLVLSCSKEYAAYEPIKKESPYVLYKEGLDAFERNDYFFASKKFSQAELNFDNIELAAKSAIMSSFSLYGINFYNEAEESLQRYLKTYPGDKNVVYAHYLLAIIYYEQISDEKKDINPVLNAKDKIDFFLKEFNKFIVPKILVLANKKGSSIERSTCDSAARCITESILKL